MFLSCGIDPSVSTSYKMEVLRDPESNGRPLFRVTLDNGEQVSCICHNGLSFLYPYMFLFLLYLL